MSESSSQSAKVWRTAGGEGGRAGLWPAAAAWGGRPVQRLVATGAIQASVVFDAQGQAHGADMAGGVQAWGPEGERRWQVSLGAGISGTPVVHPVHPRLFVGTHAGDVWALDTGDGRTVWRRAIETRSDPRILSDLLLLPGPDLVVLSSWGGRFHAVAAESGETRFTWDAGISPASGAAADREGNVYCLRAVSGRGTELVRVDAAGKHEVLEVEGEGQRGARRAVVMAAPVVSEQRGTVYAVLNRDRGARLVAWLAGERRVGWSCLLPEAVQATPTLGAEGTLWLPDLGGGVCGVSPAGELQARVASDAEYFLAGGVAEGSGAFHLGDPWGRLRALERPGVWRTWFTAERAFQARPSCDPAGRLYVPGTDRCVYVFAAAIPG